MPGNSPHDDRSQPSDQQEANATLADSFAEELGFGEQPHQREMVFNLRIFEQALDLVPEIAELIVRAMKKEITREQARELAAPHVERLKQEYRRLAEND